MAIRRNTAPRKRPTPSNTAGAEGLVTATRASEAESEGQAPSADLAEQRAEILREYESALRSQPGMDADSIELALSSFREAIETAELSPPLAAVDRDGWLRTMEALARNGLLNEQDHNALLRQFDEAMAPLQGKNVEVMLEFARRLQRDGQDNALLWLSEQSASSQEEDAKSSGTQEQPTLLRQSITRSRSRRLRGPPGS